MDRRQSLLSLGKSLLLLPIASSADILLSGCASSGTQSATEDTDPLFFKISLAQWSLHRSFFGDINQLGWAAFGKRLKSDPDSLLQGELNPMDFPRIARNTYGIDAIELVNTFYFNKATNKTYMAQFKNRCEAEGVTCVLIMCDAEGNLGDTKTSDRLQAVENHYKWVDAAAYLGCKSIRVNAAGNGTADEVREAAVDGLGRLSAYAAASKINVIVENHGGYSSNGQWLSALIQSIGMDNCGTLPDFGNFCVKTDASGCVEEYDRYIGVKELMPFAKGVSAKTHAFDSNGKETRTDFAKMLQIVKEAGYTGHIGIEYEGRDLPEKEGILATKRLLEKLG